MIQTPERKELVMARYDLTDFEWSVIESPVKNSDAVDLHGVSADLK